MSTQIQDGRTETTWHVPEPWSGHIESAPLLFIGTNPSINYDEDFPNPEWTRDHVVDFFQNRFTGGIRTWASGGRSAGLVGGRTAAANQTWSEILNRAGEILDRQPVPGIDYAITEIVHCKSKAAVGVREAQSDCAARWLRRIIEFAAANIIVALGKARPVVGNEFCGRPLDSSPLVVSVGGRDRVFIGLGKPGGTEIRKLPNALHRGSEDLSLIRRFLPGPGA